MTKPIFIKLSNELGNEFYIPVHLIEGISRVGTSTSVLVASTHPHNSVLCVSETPERIKELINEAA